MNCCNMNSVEEFLIDNTDSCNAITFKEIEKGLKRKNIVLNRKTLLGYLNRMEENKLLVFDGDGPKRKYYYNPSAERLTVEDITILVDAIQSLKCLSEELVKSIRGKLLKFTSERIRKNFQKEDTTKTFDKYKPNVEANILKKIIFAINNNRSIMFNYYRYTFIKQRIRRTNSVVVYPQAIVIDDGYYYMISYKPAKNDNVYYRIDRMGDVEIVDEQGDIPNDYKFNRAKFSSSNFKMFRGEKVKLRMKSREEFANQIIDKFGDYKLVSQHLDEDKMFEFEADVEVGETFYGWICGFGGGITIVGPEEQKVKYKEFISKLYQVSANT